MAKQEKIWYDKGDPVQEEAALDGPLTESSKSAASIAQSNKQFVGTCLYQEWCKPLLISCEAAFGYDIS